MSPSQATPAPRHDGTVLLLADQGLQSGEGMTPTQVGRKVEDFWTGIGGDEFFRALTTRFYELVADNEVLSPLFPVPDWSRHAARLYHHFRRIYGGNDLTAAWDPKMHQAHAHFLISHEQRRCWLALMKEAGTQLNAPERHFNEFLTIMKVASGEMTAVSRGAALARGERFHWDGTPA
jgi:truncated hemoglobin YjbI